MMREKRLSLFLYVIMAIITVCVALLLYWYYQPTNVINIKQPIPIKTVSDSQLVILDASYCKSIGVSGIVRTSFVGSTIEIFTPMAVENMPKGCHDNQQLPIFIPTNLPKGKYYIKINATYKINPLKTFNTIIRSEMFEIK